MISTKALHALGQLLSYPDEQTIDASELLYIILNGDLPEAAQEISAFGKFLEQHSLTDVEEVYTQTFDVNPACALEVGWHLFGEEYARGMFLVRMREELRKHGLTESTELPDHIVHVLAVLGAMPREESERFARACVLPAVQKMHQALDRKDTPYAKPISCLARVLYHFWGDGALKESELFAAPQSTHPEGVDLLHAYPVADVMSGCGGGCEGSHGPPELVQLSVDQNSAGSENR